MPVNIEVKVKVLDPDETLRRMRRLSQHPLVHIHQEDIFFNVQRGRLKLRKQPGHPAQLIYYERTNRPDIRPSTYAVEVLDFPDVWETFLTREFGVRGVVRKTRWLGRRGRTRLHLDEVEGLGWFFELEVVLSIDEDLDQGQKEALKILDAIELSDAPRIPVAYIDLLESMNQTAL